MRFTLLCILLLTLNPLAALAEPLMAEGFYLGMPRADATDIRPDIPWQEATKSATSNGTRKELSTRYLGQDAQATISLDRDARFVRIIAFAFSSASGSQCILESVGARMQLEKRYGAPLALTNEQFGKTAKWISAEGEAIHWSQACVIGSGKFFVTHTKLGS